MSIGNWIDVSKGVVSAVYGKKSWGTFNSRLINIYILKSI